MSGASTAAVLRRARRLGWVAPAAACLAALLTGGWLAQRDAVITASSTIGRYTLVYLAENLLDGSPVSMWVAEPGPASIDIDLRSLRAIEWVEVTNGDNAPYGDRSTRAFRIELYDADLRTFEVAETFDAVSTETRRVDTRGVRGDRIRIAIDSWHGVSACLAEIRWHAR